MAHEFWLSTHSFLVGKRKLQHFQVESFDIGRHVNGIPTALIVLIFNHESRDDRWKKIADDVALCKPGVAIEIGLVEEGRAPASLLFSGSITEQSISSGQGSVTVRLTARHALHRLNDGPRYCVHAPDDKDALHGLLERNNVHDFTIGELASDEREAYPEERLVQWACSDWQWLSSRLHAHGAWIFPRLKSVVCARPNLDEGAIRGRRRHKVLATDRGSILDCAWNFNNEWQPGNEEGIAVSYWDEARQSLSDEVFGTPSIIGSGAFDATKVSSKKADDGHLKAPWALRHSANHYEHDAQAEADARLLAQHACAVGFRITLLASHETISFDVGDVLSVEGFGAGLSGEGLITGIRHWWAKGAFETTVTVGLDGAAAANAALVPRAPGLTIGTVESSTRGDDERVCVNVPLLGHRLWARHAVPYAGNSFGLRLPLNPGDEVILAFLDEDPRYPVILGSTHSKYRKRPGDLHVDESVLNLPRKHKFTIDSYYDVEISAKKIDLVKKEEKEE